MFDVITFGSATTDIFLKDKKLASFIKKGFFQIPENQKIDLQEISIFSGGGGINSAMTFTSQKLKTAYCGGVGDDVLADEIIRELKNKKIDLSFTKKIKNSHTNLSIILSPKKERTILNYRCASKDISIKDIVKNKIVKTKWFYLAPLKNFEFLKNLINLAEKNKINVFLNPHFEILKTKRIELKKILAKVDTLLLNEKEFLTLLNKNKFNNVLLLFSVRKFFKGTLIITNGTKEIRILDKNNNLIFITPPEVEVIDSTGAGDAFGSGFLAGFIKYRDVGKAVDLALENSLSCIQKVGAHRGII